MCREVGEDLLLSVEKNTAGVTTGSMSLNPGSGSFPGRLAAVAALYEQMTWNSLRISWVPELGANTDGAVLLGVDWGGVAPKDVDAKHILACQPHVDAAVHSRVTMRVPVQAAQKQRWLPVWDKSEAVGMLLYSISYPAAKNPGRIMVAYDITFQGPRLPD